MYDYYVNVKQDVIEAIKLRYDAEKISDGLDESDLYVELWCDDGVTGNASGSYFCNRYKAQECVSDNFKLLADAMREFCDLESLGQKLADDEWEYLDVTIRCYVLGEAIREALNEL